MYQPDHRGRLVAAFTDDAGDGRWITIGTDGSHHGGTPVFIKDGVITKGPADLANRKISDLHAPPEIERPKEPGKDASKAEHKAYKNKLAGVHRAELNQSKESSRKEWGKKAKEIGHKPEHLHALAAEMVVHDSVGVANRTAALQSARKTIESYGGNWRTAHLITDQGGDANRIKGIDVAAEILARQHPEMFPDRETQHDSDRLFELLSQGNPKPMGDDEAYSQALDELSRHKPERVERARSRGDSYESRPRKAKASASDDVPFSDDGRGRLAAFYDEDQPRNKAGEWTTGGGGDLFGGAGRPAKTSLFDKRAGDVKPDPDARDKSLRDLSTVQKRSADWDMPQPGRKFGGASIVHLVSGHSIESTAMGDEYMVKDAGGKKIAHFKEAKDAADYIEKRAGKREASASGLAPVSQMTRGKLFDFSADGLDDGRGRLVDSFAPDRR